LPVFPAVSGSQAEGLVDDLRPSHGSPRGLSPVVSQACLTGPPLLQERLAILDSQAGQIRAQAVQESERLARDKNASLQLLQKEKERLTLLEGRYHSLTGGRSFPKTTSTLKEVTHVLGCGPGFRPSGSLGRLWSHMGDLRP